MTSGWWQSFCHRHPNLTLRTPAPLSKARHDASDPETVVRYFDLLEQTMVENDLLDKPGQIYNVDESGMPFSPRPVSVFSDGVSKTLLLHPRGTNPRLRLWAVSVPQDTVSHRW